MSHHPSIDDLAHQWIEKWQADMQKLLTDPLIQKASYDIMMHFQQIMKDGLGAILNDAQTSSFSAAQPETASADIFSFDGSMRRLDARLNAIEKRVQDLETQGKWAA